jgi:hypothetical protein
MSLPLVNPRGVFRTSFSRLPPSSDSMQTDTDPTAVFNPHQELAPYFAPRIIEGNGELTRRAMLEFVQVREIDTPMF